MGYCNYCGQELSTPAEEKVNCCEICNNSGFAKAFDESIKKFKIGR